MVRLARSLLAVAVLPFTVVVLIPVWIARRGAVDVTVPASPLHWGAWLAALPLLLAGVALFVSSLLRFHHEGDGTLAPWDPPRRLVTSGPYAYVRNPMISGVVLMLLAEALFLRSALHGAWTAGFFLINAVYVPLLEEPGLRSRFGREYETYAANVPRLVPRPRPRRRGAE